MFRCGLHSLKTILYRSMFGFDLGSVKSTSKDMRVRTANSFIMSLIAGSRI